MQDVLRVREVKRCGERTAFLICERACVHFIASMHTSQSEELWSPTKSCWTSGTNSIIQPRIRLKECSRKLNARTICAAFTRNPIFGRLRWSWWRWGLGGWWKQRRVTGGWEQRRAKASRKGVERQATHISGPTSIIRIVASHCSLLWLHARSKELRPKRRRFALFNRRRWQSGSSACILFTGRMTWQWAASFSCDIWHSARGDWPQMSRTADLCAMY